MIFVLGGCGWIVYIRKSSQGFFVEVDYNGLAWVEAKWCWHRSSHNHWCLAWAMWGWWLVIAVNAGVGSLEVVYRKCCFWPFGKAKGVWHRLFLLLWYAFVRANSLNTVMTCTLHYQLLFCSSGIETSCTFCSQRVICTKACNPCRSTHRWNNFRECVMSKGFVGVSVGFLRHWR